jgi:hypothetical protein
MMYHSYKLGNMLQQLAQADSGGMQALRRLRANNRIGPRELSNQLAGQSMRNFAYIAQNERAGTLEAPQIQWHHDLPGQIGRNSLD